jgi:hypothetical protein
MGVGGQRHAPAALLPGNSLPIVQKAGRAQRPAWTGAQNLTPIGIRSPDSPAHSQSLYRLSYPGPGLPLASPNVCVTRILQNWCSSLPLTVV